MIVTFSLCALLLESSTVPEAQVPSFFGVHTQAPAFEDEGLADPDLAPGVAVIVVVENSPAAVAGLKVGDRLLAVNGESPRTPQHLEAFVASRPVGTRLNVRLRRGVELIDVEATTVGRLEPRAAPDVRYFIEGVKLGLALVTLSEEESRAAGVGPGDGVRVRRLLEGSPAKGRLVPGDVIICVDGKQVHGGDDFLAISRSIERGKEARFRIVRQAQPLDVTVCARAPERYLTRLHFPLVVIYQNDRKKDETTLGLVLNIFKYTREEHRRTYRLLWIFSITTGTNEELEEVQE